MVLMIILLVLWYLSGVASFIFWHTKNWDLMVEELPLVFMAGIGGPLIFLVGWYNFGYDPKPPKVLIRRRGNK